MKQKRKKEKTDKYQEKDPHDISRYVDQQNTATNDSEMDRYQNAPYSTMPRGIKKISSDAFQVSRISYQQGKEQDSYDTFQSNSKNPDHDGSSPFKHLHRTLKSPDPTLMQSPLSNSMIQSYQNPMSPMNRKYSVPDYMQDNSNLQVQLKSPKYLSPKQPLILSPAQISSKASMGNSQQQSFYNQEMDPKSPNRQTFNTSFGKFHLIPRQPIEGGQNFEMLPSINGDKQRAPQMNKKYKEELNDIEEQLNIELIQNINNKINERQRHKRNLDMPFNQYATIQQQAATGNFGINNPKVSSQLSQNVNNTTMSNLKGNNNNFQQIQQNLPGPPPNYQSVENLKKQSNNSAMALSPERLDRKKLKLQQRFVTPQLPILSVGDNMSLEPENKSIKPRGRLPSLNLNRSSTDQFSEFNPEQPAIKSKGGGMGSALINAINKNKFDHIRFNQQQEEKKGLKVNVKQSSVSIQEQTFNAVNSPEDVKGFKKGLSNQKKVVVKSYQEAYQKANFKGKDIIEIVFTDTSNDMTMNLDIRFSKTLLQKYMGYFDNIHTKQNREVVVKHDYKYFELLLRYIFFMEENTKKHMKAANSQGEVVVPLLTKGNGAPDEYDSNPSRSFLSFNTSTIKKNSNIMSFAVKMLQSTDFFQMEYLYYETKILFLEHMEDFSTLKAQSLKIENREIIKGLAHMTTLGQLSPLSRSNKIVNSIFTQKFLMEIENRTVYLEKCKLCNKLFHSEHKSVLKCNRAQTGDGYHEIDPHWNFKDFVLYFRKTYQVSWREIYWKVWSYLYIFRCNKCSSFIQIPQLGTCNLEKKDGTGQFSSPTKRPGTKHNQEKDSPDLKTKKEYHQLSECYDFKDIDKEQHIITKVNQIQQLIIDNYPNNYFLQVHLFAGRNTKIIQNENQIPFNIMKPKSVNCQKSMNSAVKQYVKENKFKTLQKQKAEKYGPNYQQMKMKNNEGLGQQLGQIQEEDDEYQDQEDRTISQNITNQDVTQQQSGQTLSYLESLEKPQQNVVVIRVESVAGTNKSSDSSKNINVTSITNTNVNINIDTTNQHKYLDITREVAMPKEKKLIQLNTPVVNIEARKTVQLQNMNKTASAWDTKGNFQEQIEYQIGDDPNYKEKLQQQLQVHSASSSDDNSQSSEDELSQKQSSKMNETKLFSQLGKSNKTRGSKVPSSRIASSKFKEPGMMMSPPIPPEEQEQITPIQVPSQKMSNRPGDPVSAVDDDSSQYTFSKTGMGMDFERATQVTQLLSFKNKKKHENKNNQNDVEDDEEDSGNHTDESSSSEEASHDEGQEIDESFISTLKIDLKKKVGGGGQAKVFQCEIEGYHTQYASKLRQVYNNEALTNRALKETYNEFVLSKSLDHPNIVKYLYFVKQQTQDGKMDEYHLIMDLIKGQNLSRYIEKNGAIKSVGTIQTIGKQILQGIQYLHARNIAHLDIKPQNVMIESNLETLKLIDLGISQQLHPKLANQKYHVKGTTRYLSPDQVKGRLVLATDIWQFGCVLLELATGEQPYNKLNDFQIINHIKDNFDPLQYLIDNNPQKCYFIQKHNDLKQILLQCFNYNHEIRPTVNMLLQSEFFSNETRLESLQYYHNNMAILKKINATNAVGHQLKAEGKSYQIHLKIKNKEDKTLKDDKTNKNIQIFKNYS